MLKLDNFLPYRLSVAHRAVSDLVATAYRTQFELAVPEWRVIAVLSEHEGATQTMVATITSMDKMTVSRAVRALIKRNLIIQTALPTDRRAKGLSLSASGQALYDKVMPTAIELERVLLAECDDELVSRLHEALCQIETRARILAKTQGTPPPEAQ